MAITLNQNVKSCGRTLYRTGIPGIHVMLLDDRESFLNNQKLRLVELEDDVMFEAELRGAMNSLELNTDDHYKYINLRICKLQRQNIITSQALLRENMEILRDNKGRTLYGHVQGEAVLIHKCQMTMVKLRRDEHRCCHELPIWIGEDYQTPAFMRPVSKEVSAVCTPRVCNSFDNPIFNIGSSRLPKWVRIEDGEIKKSDNPQEFIPQSHNKEKQIVTKENDIFSKKQKFEYKKSNIIQNTRSLIKEDIVQKMYPVKVMNMLDEDISLDDFFINNFISDNLQEAFLPWPLSCLHLVPDWVILTILSIVGLFLVKLFFDPCVAICTLVKDSSLSLTEKISSAILPATAITRLNKKKQNEAEPGSFEKSIELRMTDLENQMSMFKTVFVREKEQNIKTIQYFEN